MEQELLVKNDEANKLISVVKAETEKVSYEKAITNEEEKKVGGWCLWVRGVKNVGIRWEAGGVVK